MKDYTHYEVEDFILDDSFIEWVRIPNRELDIFWQAWLQQHPDRAEVAQQARKMILSLRILPHQDLTDFEVDDLVTQVQARHEENRWEGKTTLLPWYTQRTRLWTRLAASIVLVLGLGYWGLRKIDFSRLKPGITQTDPSILEQLNSTVWPTLVRLPDGSSVVLKPGARLRYPAIFKEKQREVYLQGEAFFEVKKDASHPFLVHTGEIVAKVLGTSFVVKENPKDGQIRVIVNTGRVAVSTQPQPSASATSARKEVVLTPNQQAIFYPGEVRLERDTVSHPSALSADLVKSRFHFVQTPLSEALALLEEDYGVVIQYNRATLAHCRLTASLSDQPLYEKLTILCKAIDAHFDLVQGVIVIDGQGCNAVPSP
jgi:transmembrane sensor